MVLTTVKEALKQLKSLEEAITTFYDDPMTEYCSCVDDFQEDFARRERKILGFIMDHARKGSKNHRFAISRLGRFIP